MHTEPQPLPFHPLRFKVIVLWIMAAAAAFHIAYAVPICSCLMLIYLFGLVRMARVRTSRQAMNVGWVLGLLVYGPQLRFFWTVFGPGAITLWLVLAFWLGIFLVTLRQCHLRFGPLVAAVLTPILWLGFEFFRSELYYLRFTWLNAGYAFVDSPLIVSMLGVYGVGFVLMTIASALDRLKSTMALVAAMIALVLICFAANLPRSRTAYALPTHSILPVAGVQMEFPGVGQVLLALDKLARNHPNAELFVLSEYTFDGPVPKIIRAWCAKHRKHLIAGGKDFLDSTNSVFRNTAYVIGTNGDVVFQQAKAVPIQFFKDGLPAQDIKLWNSPWGRIGLGTCYDLSYTRVVDELVRQGAQAIINPTMDVEEWGEHQHRLHSRVPLVRAAETGLPIFRVASSGISQLITADGRLISSAAFGMENAEISGALELVPHGRVPWDRMVALLCVVVTGICLGVFGVVKIQAWAKHFRA